MATQFLVERIDPITANLVESIDDAKNYFLSGRFMTGDQKNGNQRVYPAKEIASAVAAFNAQIAEGISILGELNHPEGLGINLANVSHMITEMRMDGSNACGKCKILNTPAGNIVKGLLDGGVRLGVSSRGTGNVTNEGIVEGFMATTVDIVHNPSGPGCYPDLVRESLESQKIVSLAEAVVHDVKAQKYFALEMKKFIEKILK